MTPRLRWQTLVRSVRGPSHVRRNVPNQDAGKAVVLARGASVILAAADGHGNPLHARSQKGAMYAVDSAIEVLTGWIKATRSLPKEDTTRSAAKLPERLVAQWRKKVLSDLRANPPLSVEMRGHAGATQVKRDPSVLYGSTLLAAAMTPRFAIYLQIGDGDIVTFRRDRPAYRPVRARSDLPLSQTESLCDEDAPQRVRWCIDFFTDVALQPELALLATDGYSNSFADEEAFLLAGHQLKGYLESKGLNWVTRQLPRWLNETTRNGSGDDITVAAGWWGPVVPGPRRVLIASTLLALLVPVLLLGGQMLEHFSRGTIQVDAIPVAVDVNALAFSPDKNLILVASGQGVSFWDLHSGKMRGTNALGAPAIAFSPNGKSLAVAKDDTITVIDVRSGQTLASLHQPDVATVVALASRGNRIAAGGAYDRIKIWDAKSGSQLVTIDAQSDGVGAIAFSPTDELIGAGGQNGVVKLWSVEDGHLVDKFEGGSAPIRAIAFSSDGKHLATAQGETVVLFDRETGERVCSHSGEVHAVAFSAEGKLLASGGQDKVIRFWDMSKNTIPCPPAKR